MLGLVKKDKFRHIAYLSQTTKSKNLYENLNKKEIEPYKDKLIKFFTRKLYISGTISAIYKKNFILKVFHKIEIQKYFIDTNILMELIGKRCLFIDDYYGFNNTLSSNISSSKIDIDLFLDDYCKILKNIKNMQILEYFIKYNLKDFYSIVHREKKNQNINFLKFININLKSHYIPCQVKFYIVIFGFYYLMKIFLKKVKIL